MWIEWIQIAQSAPAGGGGATSNPLITFAPFILIIGVFWMLVIAPQRRQEREKKAMRESLSKGTLIITSGGICGSIVGTNERSVVVKISDDPTVKIEVLRTSIAHVVDKDADKK